MPHTRGNPQQVEALACVIVKNQDDVKAVLLRPSPLLSKMKVPTFFRIKLSCQVKLAF